MRQHLVVASFFDVKNFSLQGQDGLKAAVAALFRSTTGGFTLNQEELATVGIAFRTIGQLAGQSSGIERALAAGEITSLARGLPRPRRVDGFVDDLAGDRGILLEECAQPFIHKCLHHAGDIRIQLALGLAFELRL